MHLKAVAYSLAFPDFSRHLIMSKKNGENLMKNARYMDEFKACVP